jgi:hypothetical protein
MKRTTWIIMAVAGGLALQAVAAGTDNAPSATTTNVKKSTLQQRVNKFLEPKTTRIDKIDRVGGISSRPWAQTAGWASGQTQFAGDRERFYEPQFNLFWLGSTPQ